MLRGRRRGRRRRGLRLRVAGHGDGGTARPAGSAAAGSPGRAPGRGWFPSGGRGGCDPGSERERREEARGDQKGSSAAAESGAIGARRALAEPRTAPAGPLRGRRGRGCRRAAAARPRSDYGGGERAGEGSKRRPPRSPQRPAAPEPQPGAAGSAGGRGDLAIPAVRRRAAARSPPAPSPLRPARRPFLRWPPSWWGQRRALPPSGAGRSHGVAWGRGLGVLLPVPLLPGPPEGQWAVRGLRVTAVCEEGCVSFCLCGYPSKCKHLLWLFKISRCYWVTVLQVVQAYLL